MKRLLLILAMMVVAFSGCTEQGKSPEELKTLAIESSENLSSYQLLSSVNQTIELKGPAGQSTPEANVTTISEGISTESAVDLVGFKAIVRGSRQNSLKLPGQAANVSSSEAVVYQIGNSTYLQEDGETWTHLVDPRPTEEIWGGDQNNQIKALSERINQSQLEMVGSEKIEGQDSYKLKVVAGSSDYVNLYNNAFSVAVKLVQYPMLVPFINRTELNETAEMEKFVWISKESGLPVKYQSLMRFSTTPIIIGGLNPSTGEVVRFNETVSLGEVAVDIESTDIYYDINEPLEINLPEEASRAVPTYPAPLPEISV